MWVFFRNRWISRQSPFKSHIVKAKRRWRGEWAVLPRHRLHSDPTLLYKNGRDVRHPLLRVTMRWCSSACAHRSWQHKPRSRRANQFTSWPARWMGNIKTEEWLTCGYWRYCHLFNLWPLDNSAFSNFFLLDTDCGTGFCPSGFFWEGKGLYLFWIVVFLCVFYVWILWEDELTFWGYAHKAKGWPIGSPLPS